MNNENYLAMIMSTIQAMIAGGLPYSDELQEEAKRIVDANLLALGMRIPAPYSYTKAIRDTKGPRTTK